MSSTSSVSKTKLDLLFTLFYFQALLFFNSIIRLYKNENYVIKSFIRNAFERVCDVMMFCDNMNPCKMEAKDIIHFILDMHLIRSDSELR